MVLPLTVWWLPNSWAWFIVSTMSEESRAHDRFLLWPSAMPKQWHQKGAHGYTESLLESFNLKNGVLFTPSECSELWAEVSWSLRFKWCQLCSHCTVSENNATAPAFPDVLGEEVFISFLKNHLIQNLKIILQWFLLFLYLTYSLYLL